MKYYVINCFVDTLMEHNGKDVCVGKQTFLGKNEKGMFMFTEELDAYTLTFDTAVEANEYADKHLRNREIANCSEYIPMVIWEM